MTGTVIAASQFESHDTRLHWSTSDTVDALLLVLDGVLAVVPIVIRESNVEVARVVRVVRVVKDSLEIMVLVFDEAILDMELSKDPAVREAPEAVSETSVRNEALKLVEASILGILRTRQA